MTRLPIEHRRLFSSLSVRSLLPFLRVLVTISLGSLLVWAAVHKAIAPTNAERLLQAAAPFLPTSIAVKATILGEWALGVMLLAGVRPRITLSAFIVVVSLFSAVLFRAKAAGFSGSCGCLGFAATVGEALVRNGVLVAIAMIGYFTPAVGVRPVSHLAEE